MVLSSLAEGGSHVVAEAIVAGTPIVASAIDGNVGQLGADYRGLFPVRDTRALTRLLSRAELDPAFLETLTRHCRALAPHYQPARERRHLAALFRDLAP
jgi:glycosyltransferase involved in cell wall biosynthesis